MTRPASPRSVVLLGSTGSIGTQTLDVVRAAGERFSVSALAAGGRDLDLLIRQACEFEVGAVAVADPDAGDALARQLTAVWTSDQPVPQVVAGPQSVVELAESECDIVLNGVAGAQGLRATLAALRAGRTVGLANKESLIAGGPLVLGAARPGQLVAVDSEHSAIAQALRGGRREEVRRLILTASGGPFRGLSRQQMRDVTPLQALAHPTWSMGSLITTNSATLVNKGLELIEAALLFDADYEAIDVVVHPQSIVHSMVEFVDGSTLVQASPPDMRLPISLALGWPARVPDAAQAVDWAMPQQWTFEPADEAAFPAIGVARRAGASGGCAPAVFNAVNEYMVGAFHAGRCGFLDIVDVAAQVLQLWLDTEHDRVGNPRDLSDVEEAENWARRHAVPSVASGSR